MTKSFWIGRDIWGYYFANPGKVYSFISGRESFEKLTEVRLKTGEKAKFKLVRIKKLENQIEEMRLKKGENEKT